MQQTLTRIAIVVARLAGTAALVLGVLLWLGQGGALFHAHMGSGALLVLALWALAILGLKAAPALAILGATWGVVVLGLGVFQTALLPGEYHWVIQAAHLLVGLSAMVQTERLAGAIARRSA